jgi:molybdopterin molybdotransferase
MPEFLELLPPAEALERFLSHLPAQVAFEVAPITQALGRVIAAPIIAPHALPPFVRSTVDGFAVHASDTYGASESLPAYLRLIGEVRMGGRPDFALQAAQCASIHTGGMLPDSADAVVMLEYTQGVSSGEVEILRSVAVGENVIKIGEDVSEGEIVIPAGACLRPAEIGGLAAFGITEIQVARQPRVAILSSGDEVVPLEVEPQPGQVRDVNTLALSALVAQNGGLPVAYGIFPDDFDILRENARRALTECDLMVFTAGSSASARDLTARVIDELGEPGVLVHGVSIRPGKPTILAVCQGKAVIGLPGNPVSALNIAGLFLTPALEKLLGLKRRQPRPVVLARLTINIASQAGREDWIPVRLTAGETGILAEPVFGKSNLIFTLVRADGMLRIPPDANGIGAGEIVEVYLDRI